MLMVFIVYHSFTPGMTVSGIMRICGPAGLRIEERVKSAYYPRACVAY